MSVYDVCKAECIRQGDDSPAAISGLMVALSDATMVIKVTEGDIKDWAGYINREIEMDYRRHDVTFVDVVSRPAHWSVIERVMKFFVKDALNNPDIPVDEVVKEFLDIHPFTDGNGRVAFVLYNWLNGTLSDPTPLPYYYGDK